MVNLRGFWPAFMPLIRPWGETDQPLLSPPASSLSSLSSLSLSRCRRRSGVRLLFVKVPAYSGGYQSGFSAVCFFHVSIKRQAASWLKRLPCLLFHRAKKKTCNKKRRFFAQSHQFQALAILYSFYSRNSRQRDLSHGVRCRLGHCASLSLQPFMTTVRARVAFVSSACG